MDRTSYEARFLNKRCLNNLRKLIRLAFQVNRLLKQGYFIVDSYGDWVKEPFIFEHDTYGNFRIFGNFTQLLLYPKSENAEFEPEEVEWCEYDEELLEKIFGGYRVANIMGSIDLRRL